MPRYISMYNGRELFLQRQRPFVERVSEPNSDAVAERMLRYAKLAGLMKRHRGTAAIERDAKVRCRPGMITDATISV